MKSWVCVCSGMITILLLVEYWIYSHFVVWIAVLNIRFSRHYICYTHWSHEKYTCLKTTNFWWKLIFQPLPGRVYINLPEGIYYIINGHICVGVWAWTLIVFRCFQFSVNLSVSLSVPDCDWGQFIMHIASYCHILPLLVDKITQLISLVQESNELHYQA